jgi:hypothetical protein
LLILRYYRYVAEFGEEMNFAKKCELIHRAYFGGDEFSIMHYFQLTGLLGSTSPDSVAARLLSEGIYSSAKFRDLHQRQQEAYTEWNKMKSRQKLQETPQLTGNDEVKLLTSTDSSNIVFRSKHVSESGYVTI